MIEPTDEMIQLALDIFLATPPDSIAQIDAGMGKALTAAFALVERDYRIEPRPPWERGEEWNCIYCGYSAKGPTCGHCGRTP